MTKKSEVLILISKEIKAHHETTTATIADLRREAYRLIERADTLEELRTKQLLCDANGEHEFEMVPGSGMLGDRFQEVCKHCKWCHES